MHQEKKQRLQEEGHQGDMVAGNEFLASFDDLVDVLPNILGYLTPKDIMCKRCINKKVMEAAKKTFVPLTEFRVHTLDSYNAMRVMTEALPNLQQIWICNLGTGLMIQPREWEHNWSDGEDPDQERTAVTADTNRYDIEIISNFSKLRMLRISSRKLNGRFPFLFNSFPLLQKLSFKWCHYLKWDLEMLAGLPMLKELECYENLGMTGNIISLRVLKDTLEKVVITEGNVQGNLFISYRTLQDHEMSRAKGNFMDLADFPHLKVLDLTDTAVTGDIRDIGGNDFSSLEQLKLPKTVYGAAGYEFQSISDGTALIRAVYLLKKQRPALKIENWYGKLSEDSPDWYESMDEDGRYFSPTPFFIRFIEAGSRIGYRWESAVSSSNPCEANWLDPEPDRESSDYERYVEELQGIEAKVIFYRGFHQPPTEEEYHRLVEEHRQV